MSREDHHDMGFASTAFFLAAIGALCAAIWGIFSKQRSAFVGVIAASVAVLAAVGAWYAWAESQSMPWTVGYGVVAVAGVASAMRQCVGCCSSRKDP